MSQLDFIENQNNSMIWPCGILGGVAYKDNVIDQNICAEIIDLFSSMPDRSFPGMTLGGKNDEVKVTTDWHMDQHYDTAVTREHELDTIIYNSLWNLISLYKENFDFLQPYENNVPLYMDSGYQVQRYLKSAGFYKEHIDGSPWQIDVRNRVLSAIIYLNTVEIGGETCFPTHNLDIQPVSGRIVLFPASWTHPHIAKIPLSSDKWIISTFINCGVLSD